MPKDAVDPDKVELKFNEKDGHYLVLDDGNPHNNLVNFGDHVHAPVPPSLHSTPGEWSESLSLLNGAS